MSLFPIIIANSCTLQFIEQQAGSVFPVVRSPLACTLLLLPGDSEGSKAVKTVWDETLNRKESVVQKAFCQLKIALVRNPETPKLVVKE